MQHINYVKYFSSFSLNLFQNPAFYKSKNVEIINKSSNNRFFVYIVKSQKYYNLHLIDKVQYG